MSDNQLVFEDATKMCRVVLDIEVMNNMFRLCCANQKYETGGILIGNYSEDLTTASISEATCPATDSKFGRTWFHRGNEGLKDILVDRWNRSPQTYYVGEWHFHPANDPRPSAQDNKQMREVSTDSSYSCSKPILMIIYLTKKDNFSISCFVISNEKSIIELKKINTK